MPDINYYNQLATQLLAALADHALPVQNKYAYYNATQPLKDIGISLPEKMANLRPGVGWASRAVNTLADRLNFDGFANDRLGINIEFGNRGAFKALERAKTDAIIAGCSFVSISEGNDGYRLVPFTAQEATGIIDEATGILKAGLAVTKWYGYREGLDQPCWGKVGLVPQNYVLFTRETTVIFINGQVSEIRENRTGRPLLAVITHRQSIDRPFGKARISNTVRRIIDEVGRLKVRYEVAAEFYSTPQRYFNGVAQGAISESSVDYEIGKLWITTKDEDGEKPEIGQLAQMSISQFSEQKKDLARDFCAETALTLRNLGYETANPTSAESLRSMSDDLLLEAQECEEEMGREFKAIAETYIMAKYRIDQVPEEAIILKPSWKPVAQLDLGATGDAIYKLYEIMPELKGSAFAYRMLGMDMEEAEELTAKKASLTSGDFMATEEN